MTLQAEPGRRRSALVVLAIASGMLVAPARALLGPSRARARPPCPSQRPESAATITPKTVERYAANPRLARAQAPQETQIELIDAKSTPQDWAHPAFWAAFTLVGDGRRPDQ